MCVYVCLVYYKQLSDVESNVKIRQDELTMKVLKENAAYNIILIQDGMAYERIITTTSRVNSYVTNDAN